MTPQSMACSFAVVLVQITHVLSSCYGGIPFVRKVEMDKATDMYGKIMSEKEVSGLRKLLEECRSCKTGARAVLLEEIFLGLSLRSRIPMDRTETKNSDDLSTERGRCAFFFRGLLDVDFPPVRLEMDAKDYKKERDHWEEAQRGISRKAKGHCGEIEERGFRKSRRR